MKTSTLQKGFLGLILVNILCIIIFAFKLQPSETAPQADISQYETKIAGLEIELKEEKQKLIAFRSKISCTKIGISTLDAAHIKEYIKEIDQLVKDNFMLFNQHDELILCLKNKVTNISQEQVSKEDLEELVLDCIASSQEDASKLELDY